MRGTLGDVDLGEPRGEYVLVVAGAPPTPPSAPDDDAIRAALREELAAGASRRDAARRRRPPPRRAAARRTTSRSPSRRRLPCSPTGDASPDERPVIATTGDRPVDEPPDPATSTTVPDPSEYGQMVGSGPSAAFFDLDRTLIAGSSAFIVAPHAPARRASCRRSQLRSATPARRWCSRCAARATGRPTACATASSARSPGCARTTSSRSTPRCCPKLLAKIRPEARRLLDLHRHAGRNTYIVSAAPVEIVEPLAHSLGMTAGIGTRGAGRRRRRTTASSTGRSATAPAR